MAEGHAVLSGQISGGSRPGRTVGDEIGQVAEVIFLSRRA
jgi:hypothetical protein